MGNHKRGKTGIKLLLTVLVLGIAVCAFSMNKKEEEFSCYTFDSLGHRINGYWVEDEQMWCLFVTSGQEIKDIEIHYSGSIRESSAGELDTRKKIVSGGFVESGDHVELTAPDGSVNRVAVMGSDLPSVYIDLQGTTLDEIHADKDVKHAGNSIYIIDPDRGFDLTVEDSLEIKGRGNSSWMQYEKKGYQIKFASKTAVMGMDESKKWVLLANASDDSMMRTQLVYQMAQNLGMEFVPTLKYVDLWIEGEYRGTYLLGEKVELGGSRLDLENDSGALFEHDQNFYLEEDYWFYCQVMERYFTLKEINLEEPAVIETAMADFSEALEELILFLYETPSDEVTLEALSARIDVDSFVKYYLINEYTLNRESFATSFYWYQDGADDVIHLGPIWDFDTCMGNDGTANTVSYGAEHVLFHYLLSSPEFYAKTLELWELYRAELEGMTENVDAIRSEIAASAEMNYLRWDVLGQPNPKGGADFYPTFDEAADAVRSWLAGREEAFRIPENRAVASVVSDDCEEMEICYRDGENHRNMVFSVWSKTNDRDDLNWYSAEQDEDGVWRCTVDLEEHNSAGIYYIYAYADDSSQLVAAGRNYAEIARGKPYIMRVSVSGDGLKLKVQLVDNTGDLTSASVAVWGTLAGQENTLKWWSFGRGEGNLWTVNIPLCRMELETEDYLAVNAYGTGAGGEILLDTDDIHLAKAVAHQVDEEIGICAICGLDPDLDIDELGVIPMYRLYEPISGAQFYTGSEGEIEQLISTGWESQGIAWYAPAFEGGPVTRLYNPNTGAHFYTMSQAEIDALTGAGWQYEGVCWNTPAEGIPVYRLWSEAKGVHYYTGDEEEIADLLSQGWVSEGVGWYGVDIEKLLDEG
ncbi:MAG: CotH kinase family protein [Lachnospiraceae bacterium]|nr:CotH kinase family protein [Lachnospiraceae bacterium]